MKLQKTRKTILVKPCMFACWIIFTLSGLKCHKNLAGLGIRTLVFRANPGFLPKTERMSDSLNKTSDSLIRSFLMSDLRE